MEKEIKQCEGWSDEKAVVCGRCSKSVIGKEELIEKLIIQYKKQPEKGILYIVDSGDDSRYHEIIALDYRHDEWKIIEDYLSPEERIFRTTPVNLVSGDEVALRIWLSEFIDCHEKEIMNEYNNCVK